MQKYENLKLNGMTGIEKIYVNTYTYIYSNIQTCINTYTHTYIHTHMYTCIPTYIHAYLHTYTYIHKYITWNWRMTHRTDRPTAYIKPCICNLYYVPDKWYF